MKTKRALTALVLVLALIGFVACGQDDPMIGAEGIRYGQYGSAVFHGSVIVDNDLTVTDDATISSDLAITADVTVGDTLDVDGDIDLDGDGFDVNITAGFSVDGDAASNINVAGAGLDLTIESEAGRVVIKGDEAAADGVYIDADDAAGTGVDIDVGASGGLSIDGGLTNIGSGTCETAAGDNDLCIDADLEVDGVAELDAVRIDSTLTMTTTNAAGASANPFDYTATAGIMNGSDTLEIIDINMTGANHSGTGNVVAAISIDLTTVDPQVAEKAIDIDDTDFDYAIDAGAAVILNTAQTIFVDFYGDALPGELVLLNGNDAQAVDPAIVANEQYGVVTLVSGDVGDTCANDCSELGFGTVYRADQGNLVFEIRLHIDTAVTNASVCAGFTDVATIEAPAYATGGGDGITAVADDAIAFCFDDAATTKEWFSFGIDGTTQATGNGMVGVGPTHSVYQVLRIEVDAGGEDARFYIDGTLVDTLTANVVTITDDLMPFVSVDSNTTASVTIDVDYIFVSANRG